MRTLCVGKFPNRVRAEGAKYGRVRTIAKVCLLSSLSLFYFTIVCPRLKRLTQESRKGVEETASRKVL